MKSLVVLDTNVIISAILTKSDDSPPRQIWNSVLDSNIILVVNDQIIEEYSTVLRRTKFNIDPSLVDKMIEDIKNASIRIEKINSGLVLPDEKDVPFYEAALYYGCFLITGNKKHFPKDPLVMSPREWVEKLK